MKKIDWINRTYRDIVNIHWKRAVVLPALQHEVVGKLYDEARKDLELRIAAIREWAVDKRKAIKDAFPHSKPDGSLQRDKDNQTIMLDRLLEFMADQGVEAMGFTPGDERQVTGKCVTCRVILHVGDTECPGCHRKLGESS